MAPAPAPQPAAPAVRLPPAPALVARPRFALWLTPDGEVEELGHAEAARRAESAPPLVCHAPATAARLGGRRFRAFDVLELFAFALPARFCVPTPAGLASALGLPVPAGVTAEALMLRDAAAHMLGRLALEAGAKEPAAIAHFLEACGWAWAPPVLAALGAAPSGAGAARLDFWSRLPEWSEPAPAPEPGHHAVSGAEAAERLAGLLGTGSEPRPQQRAYAEAAAQAFAPRDEAGAPHVVLAEAGTGVGKTVGYIAPASLWAEKNGGSVWLSTYTRNLQRQIDTELDRLYPDPAAKRAKVVVRKGRENYLCLLNLEEEPSRAALGVDGVGAGLVARWALATRDGDMGGDFPAWLPRLVGGENTLGLTDRRGECVYAACKHYRRCFIEHSQRRARRASLVIANHALVLANAARADDGRDMPTRYVFDEGHHLFDAADSAFSAHLTAAEAAELRRWLRGPEGSRRRRARSLEQRVGDLAAGSEAARDALDSALRAANALPAPGWLNRLRDGAEAATPAERFLAEVRGHVLARQTGDDAGYTLEADASEPTAALLDAAADLHGALAALARPLVALTRALAARLDDEAADLPAETRQRIEAACRGLGRRADAVEAWREMLAGLEQGAPEAFVDWFSLERAFGRESDVGMHRHWVDPTVPFADVVLHRAHGVLITSASLRDHGDGGTANETNETNETEGAGSETSETSETEETTETADWLSAEVRTGAHHLALPARWVSHPSPFDYGAQTRLLLVRDVRRDDAPSVAAAYRELFVAAGGGGLGLFTAIARLRAVHRRIAAPLDEAGITLLAQHVDAMDTATLVDIFRAERHACLLGTDAVRDGVDVPGDALRLIVFDRVPWPRPSILHRARKQAFGGPDYDDMLARLRLRQAYGRLVRRATDRGVFVLLDAMAPSRLLAAFPAAVAPERVGIAEAVAATRAFLATDPSPGSG